jgi:nucleoside-diphosphate-sugar epimerase
MSTDLALECPPVATLLTGVGYIGATLLRRLADRGTDWNEPIVALDNFYSTSRDQVEASLPAALQVQLLDGDVADPGDVARAFDSLEAQRKRQEPEPAELDELPGHELTVFHLAAQPSAAVAVRDPEVTERANLTGARIVLEAAKERGARVIFGGSFRVYGDELTNQTIDEETPYGRVGDLSHLSKIYVEQLARMIGVRFVSVRLGVAYGLSPIMKTTPAFMTVPNLFCHRAAQGEVLQVLEDRPLAFIHVEDAADALIISARRAERVDWSVVNAAPEVATIGQLARTVQRLVQSRGASVRVQGAASSGAGFRVRSQLDGDGFVPRHTLADGLVDVLDYFLKQQ